MLILGTMQNLEVYAIAIQKNDGAIFKKSTLIPFWPDWILLTKWPIVRSILFLKPITKTYACRVSYESSSCVENEFTFTFNIYYQSSDFERS